MNRLRYFWGAILVGTFTVGCVIFATWLLCNQHYDTAIVNFVFAGINAINFTSILRSEKTLYRLRHLV